MPIDDIPVHFHPLLGGIFGVAALGIFGVGVAIEAPHLLILGGVQIVSSLLFLTRPMFVFGQSRVDMKNLIGSTTATHEFSAPRDLEIRGGAIYFYDRKIVGSRYLAKASDWQAMIAAIEAPAEPKPTAPREQT